MKFRKYMIPVLLVALGFVGGMLVGKDMFNMRSWREGYVAGYLWGKFSTEQGITDSRPRWPDMPDL